MRGFIAAYDINSGKPVWKGKCSCALDAVAEQLRFDDYVTLSTISKAMSIVGERGGSIRDAPSFEPQAKRFRELQSKAETGCFITSEAR